MFSADNVLVFLGIVDTGKEIKPAGSLTEVFFAIKPELRNKAIDKWIELLDAARDLEYVDALAEEVAPGEMAVLIHDDVIEKKIIPDNVVLFPGGTLDS